MQFHASQTAPSSDTITYVPLGVCRLSISRFCTSPRGQPWQNDHQHLDGANTHVIKCTQSGTWVVHTDKSCTAWDRNDAWPNMLVVGVVVVAVSTDRPKRSICVWRYDVTEPRPTDGLLAGCLEGNGADEQGCIYACLHRVRASVQGHSLRGTRPGTAVVSVDAGSPLHSNCTSASLKKPWPCRTAVTTVAVLLVEKRALRTRHRAATTILSRGPFWLYNKLPWCGSTPQQLSSSSALKEDDGPPGVTLPTLQKPLCTSLRSSHLIPLTQAVNRTPPHNMNGCSQGGPFPMVSDGLMRILKQGEFVRTFVCRGYAVDRKGGGV